MNTEIEKSGEFEITPCQAGIVKSNKGYKKLSISGDNKKLVIELAYKLIKSIALNDSANGISLKYRKGISNTVDKLDSSKAYFKTGGSVLYSDVEKYIMLFEVVLGITYQFYLSYTENKMNEKTNFDSVLDFLETDKKSELLSEINFVKRAFTDYHLISPNNDQRISMITNLQNTEKVSFKDCEFYSDALRKTVYRDSHIEEDVRLSLKYKELLEVSVKLYTESVILEAYYAHNDNKEYINRIRKDLTNNISRYESIIFKAFTHLKKRVNNTYDTWYWKFMNREQALKKIQNAINSYENGKSVLYQNTKSALDLLSETKEYYIDKTGDVFVKTDKI